jgi:hypothetical protein
MRERKLREAWVEHVIASPDWTISDDNPVRRRAFGAIEILNASESPGVADLKKLAVDVA